VNVDADGRIRRVAFHEAGHAVAGFLLGRGAPKIRIAPDDETAGSCEWRPRGEKFVNRVEEADYESDYGGFVDAWTRREVEVDMMVTLAGMVTEEFVLGSYDKAGVGIAKLSSEDAQRFAEKFGGTFESVVVDGDMKAVNDLATKVSGSDDEAGAYIAWLEQRVRNFVRRPDFVPAVEAVASALVERRTLSSAETRRIITGALDRLSEERAREFGPRIGAHGGDRADKLLTSAPNATPDDLANGSD
jgi:hypothetical protein